MSNCWKILSCGVNELRLDVTLPTGQSFRWQRVEQGLYVGVVAKRLVALRESSQDVEYRVLGRGSEVFQEEDEACLRDYFNLNYNLQGMVKQWKSKDERFRQIIPYFPGARMLRQDPLECLFSFLCSQNNHIQRIQGMVQSLARNHGTQIFVSDQNCEIQEEGLNDLICGEQFYAFPTLEQLKNVNEEDLRQRGFGYRAKYVVGTVEVLLGKEGGGEEWLMSLRKTYSYQEAQKELCKLPGIGPKVAACICLFSLDKHEAIPVDTHVWQLACRYYSPHLKDKSVTPKIMKEVEAAMIEVFGSMAGWAHNVLFISELPQLKERLPNKLRPAVEAKNKKQKQEREEVKATNKRGQKQKQTTTS